MITAIIILSCLLAIATTKIILNYLFMRKVHKELKEIRSRISSCIYQHSSIVNNKLTELGGFLGIDYEEITCKESDADQSTQV